MYPVPFKAPPPDEYLGWSTSLAMCRELLRDLDISSPSIPSPSREKYASAKRLRDVMDSSRDDGFPTRCQLFRCVNNNHMHRRSLW